MGFSRVCRFAGVHSGARASVLPVSAGTSAGMASVVFAGARTGVSGVGFQVSKAGRGMFQRRREVKGGAASRSYGECRACEGRKASESAAWFARLDSGIFGAVRGFECLAGNRWAFGMSG